jgi:hypothetical protein
MQRQREDYCTGKACSDSTPKDFRTPLQANVAAKEIGAFAPARATKRAITAEKEFEKNANCST